MWQAYVGIVSQRGLEVFCREDPHVFRFLLRRARRIPGRAGCFWTVLAHDRAALIQRSLREGQNGAALALVQRDARELGPMLPSDTEPADAVNSVHHA